MISFATLLLRHGLSLGVFSLCIFIYVFFIFRSYAFIHMHKMKVLGNSVISLGRYSGVCFSIFSCLGYDSLGVFLITLCSGLIWKYSIIVQRMAAKILVLAKSSPKLFRSNKKIAHHSEDKIFYKQTMQDNCALLCESIFKVITRNNGSTWNYVLL